MANMNISTTMTCNNCNNQDATMKLDEAKRVIIFHCENCGTKYEVELLEESDG